MNREEALRIWAPSHSPWSRWTKAVLFSFMYSLISDTHAATRVDWTVPLLNDAALVLNLPEQPESIMVSHLQRPDTSQSRFTMPVLMVSRTQQKSSQHYGESVTVPLETLYRSSMSFR